MFNLKQGLGYWEMILKLDWIRYTCITRRLSELLCTWNWRSIRSWASSTRSSPNFNCSGSWRERGRNWSKQSISTLSKRGNMCMPVGVHSIEFLNWRALTEYSRLLCSTVECKKMASREWFLGAQTTKSSISIRRSEDTFWRRFLLWKMRNIISFGLCKKTLITLKCRRLSKRQRHRSEQKQ